MKTPHRPPARSLVLAAVLLACVGFTPALPSARAADAVVHAVYFYSPT